MSTMNAFSPTFYDWRAREFMTYDPRRVFDDVLGEGWNADEQMDDMAAAVAESLARVRLSPLPHDIVETDVDMTEYTFDAPDKYTLGASTDEIIDAVRGEFPIFATIRDRFARAIGRPKVVRVDGEQSYADFRARRREPYMDSLDARLARLEHAFSQHISDQHGGFGNDVQAFERYLDHGEAPAATQQQAVIGEVRDTVCGGRAVSLGARGVECWVDGDEVLVSVRMPDGIATTGVPLLPEVEDVVGCAEKLGCDREQALVLGCQVAPMTAGRRLIGDIVKIAPSLRHGVQVASPRSDASLAAGMTLLQRAQRGDRPSIREALKMAHGAYKNFMETARDRLMHGQADKARGVV